MARKKRNINQHFEKVYTFQIYPHVAVPLKVYEAEKWEISDLQQKKLELNKTKGLLNKYDLSEWSRHTQQTEVSSLVQRFLKKNYAPELLTQAWCKFYECICGFSLVPSHLQDFRTLHLCEAPGAFISALNHYIQSNCPRLNWQWKASSLSPDYEGHSYDRMIPDERLFRVSTNHWILGLDQTGDITKYYNYLAFTEEFKTNKVLLVTADGSINCMADPGNQESTVEFLHYCETMTALSVLKKGGHYVLKIFTMFEDTTICLLYLLKCNFECMSIFKPCTSKSGNSEVYVICRYFKGTEMLDKQWETLLIPYKSGEMNRLKSMFDLDHFPSEFLEDIEKCSSYFMEKQTTKIIDNIQTFESGVTEPYSTSHKIQIANCFIQRFKIRKIPNELKLSRRIDINRYYIPKPPLFMAGKTSELLRYAPTNQHDLIEVKRSLKFVSVNNSHFCSPDFFTHMNRISTCDGAFYKTLKGACSKSSLIVDYTLFKNYSDFHRTVLAQILNNSEKNTLVFVDIPLVTNFLAGLIYLLCMKFENICLHLNCLVLTNICQDKAEFIDICLSLIADHFNVESNSLCDLDVNQIIPNKLILRNKFHNFLICYNDWLLSRFEDPSFEDEPE